MYVLVKLGSGSDIVFALALAPAGTSDPGFPFTKFVRWPEESLAGPRFLVAIVAVLKEGAS